MTGELGKASLDLEANLGPFLKDMKLAKGSADDVEHALDALAAVSKLAEDALKRVKMSPGQSVESKTSAEGILSGVRGISEEARTAARELDNVKLDQAQAVESKVAAQEISSGLNEVSRNADQAKRKLAEVSLASRNPGAGVGPFGSGFGRIGALGAAIGAGTLATPAAGPAALGLLAAIPALSAAGAGSLGTLALAFDGVGKAIGGDKKAFDGLVPSAQKFTLLMRSLDGEFDKLKETAASSLFPGLTDALHSALSPGTLSAVTTAIKEFGNAIGAAGAAWGRYFGSAEFQSIFIPMMHAGAHDLTLMSAAALSLFDAFGVLGRAAIPFTNWLLTAIDKGSQFVDTWLHAKDATGQLGHALDEAKTSLQIVAGLVAALFRVVGALGQALYPVSQIFLKDLTDGLNALAGIIRRNQDGIREFVGGALSALVSTVKTLAPLVASLAHGLSDVVHAIGGWKTAFEIIIGGFLALKFVALAGSIAGVASKVALIGVDATIAVGELGGLRAALLGLGAPEVLGAIAAAAAAFAIYKGLSAADPTVVGTTSSGSNVVSASGKLYVQAPGGGRLTRLPPGTKYKPTSAPPGGADRHGPAASRASAPAQTYSKAQLEALWIQAGGDPSVASTMAAIALAESSGRTNATNANTNGTTDRGLWQINSVHGYAGASSFDALQNAKQAVSVYNSQGITAWSTYNNGAYAKYTGAGGASPFGSTPAWTKNTGSKPTKPTMPTGANLLPSALRDALQKAKDMATTTQGATASHWLQIELADLDKAHADLETQLKSSSGKKKAAIQQELRNIDGQIASVNRQITVNLHAQAQAIKTTFSSQISTAKSNVTSAMSTLKATLDAQLQANLQNYIDTVLGPKFFQGTDAHGRPLQTPLEAQLAGMNAADTKQSLQDGIDAAKQQLELDRATAGVTADQLKADQKAIDQAQRSFDENDLAMRATAERAQADYDYAQAVKTATADEQEAQRQLNLQLDTFGKGLADGTTKLSDLGGIVGAFGLSLTDPGGIVDDFDALSSATSALAKVMLLEALALARVGDAKDSSALQAIADTIGWQTDVGAGQANVTAGLGGAGGFFKLNPIPSLDVGGTVLRTGLAMVHRGETYSGVGNQLGGDLHIHVGTMIGGRPDQVARDLKPYLDRVIQL